MAADLTIEQLASASGMSVRNIRAHQARGLVDPPEVRLRVGYYGPEQLAQLALIRDLQADGFNLAGIKRLLESDDPTAARLAHFRATLTAAGGVGAEAPQTLAGGELRRRFAVDPDTAPAVLARAERLGILVADGADRFLVPSPVLLAIAERVVARGVSIDAALAVFERVREQCDAAAAAFVELFVDEVFRPFAQAGMPDDRWDELDEAAAALYPLAGEALQAIFGPRMSARIDAAVNPPRRG